MWSPDLFRTTAFRLSAAFCILLAVLTGGTFFLIYWQVALADINRIHAVLENAARFAAMEDDSDLRRALQMRLTDDFHRLDFLGAFDAEGKPGLGNLDAMPPIAADGVAHFLESYSVEGVAPERDEPMLFVARPRATGGVIVLGRRLGQLLSLRLAVERALEYALVPTALAIMATGLFFSFRARARLRAIERSINAIMAGDLRARLPRSSFDDEVNAVNQSVNGMLDEIERLLDQLQNVGDNMAHELRSPIANVRAKVERALALDDLPDQARAPLDAALVHIDRAMLTISALLRISAAESGRRRSGFESVDLAAVCNDVFEFLSPAAQVKSIHIDIDAPEPVLIRGDPDLLREAIANIVDNAIKYSPPGASVTIECRMVDSVPQIVVADTGPGVQEADRERIFLRRYRGQCAHGPDAPAGVGIGLSISSAIANLHGFTITVSDNAPGARFAMVGPAQGTPANARGPAKSGWLRPFAHFTRSAIPMLRAGTDTATDKQIFI